MKSNIILFARDYQAKLLPQLNYAEFNPLFVTLTIKESELVKSFGFDVIACFEKDYDSIEVSDLEDDYLDTSLLSDRFLININLQERIELLKKEVYFWRKIFVKYRPLAILNEIIAIEMSEVMNIEARRLNIKYLSWLVSPFKGKNFYWTESPYNSSLTQMLQDINVCDESMSFAKEYKKNLTKANPEKPYYVCNLKSRMNFMELLKFIRVFIIEFFKHKLIRNIKDSACSLNSSKLHFIRIQLYFLSIFYKYDNLDKLNKFGIVFYPLHFEPEASIIYFSEFNENQIGLIRNIARCIKLNQVLIIKEHPQQPGMLLSKPYRKLQKEIPNLFYLPSEYNTKDLIIKSDIIVTQTSSAGWEGLFFKKPVVVLGNVFYDHYSMVNKFTDFNYLRESIRTNSLKISDDKSITEYTAKMYQYCNFGNPFCFDKLYSKENINLVSDAIVKKLREISSEK